MGNLTGSGSRIVTRVYSAGARWIWVVQEFGSTLRSGTAWDKESAKAKALEAKGEINASSPGGLSLVGSKHKSRRMKVRMKL